MMSLFSSFDMFFFYKVFFFFLMFLFIFLSSYFFLSSSNYLMAKLIEYLEVFFISLKPKNFNKFSLFFSLSLALMTFMFNFYSVFSFSFPVTSQFGLVLMLALTSWSSFFFFNSCKNYKGVIAHFIPEGTPMLLTSLLFLIEFISNMIRPITLTVRLVANILAGHLLMILLSNLVLKFGLVFPMYILLNSVELFVALIQSYIFCTMLVLYFSEVH